VARAVAKGNKGMPLGVSGVKAPFLFLIGPKRNFPPYLHLALGLTSNVNSVEGMPCRVCERINFSNERHPRREKETIERKLRPLISQVSEVRGSWTLVTHSRAISLRTQLKEAWAHVPTFEAHIQISPFVNRDENFVATI
jgi:hypothetical protein